jgi:hypothetical protein
MNIMTLILIQIWIHALVKNEESSQNHEIRDERLEFSKSDVCSRWEMKRKFQLRSPIHFTVYDSFYHKIIYTFEYRRIKWENNSNSQVKTKMRHSNLPIFWSIQALQLIPLTTTCLRMVARDTSQNCNFSCKVVCWLFMAEISHVDANALNELFCSWGIIQ